MIELFARHKVAANLTMVVMIMAGIWALYTVPAQLDPPTKATWVGVEITWPGSSAEDVAQLVTTPVENQLQNLPGVKEMHSRSIPGFARVVMQFHFDEDMTLALDNVKQRIDSIRNLPRDIEVPNVYKIERYDTIVTYQVTGNGDVNELIPIVKRWQKELMQRGIDRVWLSGLPAEEMAVQVSSRKLLELGLTHDELAQQIAGISKNVPAGQVGKGQGTRQLRSLDQRRDPMEFEQLYIESEDQLIRLGSIASVERRPKEGQTFLTREGRPTIILDLERKPSTDLKFAHDAAEAWLAETLEKLPPGMEITRGWDSWDLMGAQYDLIVKNGLGGLLLVIITLFVFLNGRVGFWVMVGIPVSFALALAVLWGGFGYGLAIVCLFGFIMSLGIVVDDAIVVAEHSVHQLETGHSPLQAATIGARRMFIPVVASSLTTLAAFMPIIIVGGEMGESVLALPAVLLCVVIASLIECFLVLPGHLAHSLRNYTPPSPESFRARFDAAFLRFRQKRFDPFLHKALDYPGATICAALGIGVLAVTLLASERVKFSMDVGFSPERLVAQVEYAASATDAQKAAFVEHLETTLRQTDEAGEQSNVNGWVLRHNGAEFNEEWQRGTQFSSLLVRYAFKEKRTIDPGVFSDDWRSRITKPPYVEQLLVGVEGGINNGRPDLSLVLTGDDPAALKKGSEELRMALAQYPGVSNVIDNLPYGSDQVVFELTPEGRALGLTSQSLGRQLHAAYSGRRVQIFNQDETELEVKVMLPDDERDKQLALLQFPVKTPGGHFVPLANVAKLSNRRGVDLIRHTNSRNSITVSANVDSQVNTARNILGDIKENHLPGILARNQLEFDVTGGSQEEQILLDTMALGAKLTLVLIFLILAWVFSSYLWPLAIMLAIPFGLTGAIAGHWIMGINLNAMSLLALMSLSGIVVNDSIVLLNFFKHDVDAGKPIREALERAVSARFRAVVLTSLTTIAGLLPLMFETSSLATMIRPIAVTICFGLAYATFLILLVIPAFVLLLESLKARAGSLSRNFRPGLQGATR